MKSNEKKYDLFLSYSHKEESKVLKLAENLRDRGLNIFLDIWELKLGDVITREIEDALSVAKSGAIFFSSYSLKSRWVRLEYDRMISKAISDESFRIIPIRLETCDIPAFASDRLYYDFFELTEHAIDRAGREIIKSLGLNTRNEPGILSSLKSEISEKLCKIVEGLKLDKDIYLELFEIIKLLKNPETGVHNIGQCVCGGQELCGGIDLGGVDYYMNYFHICPECLRHRHKEKYIGITQDTEDAMTCPFCAYNKQTL